MTDFLKRKREDFAFICSLTGERTNIQLRGGYRISPRGRLPGMNWCSNAIEWCILNDASPSPSQGWAPAPAPPPPVYNFWPNFTTLGNT